MENGSLVLFSLSDCSAWLEQMSCWLYWF